MRWALLVVVVIAVLAGAVAIIGAMLPRNHKASRTARFKQPPEMLWQAITDYAGSPAWRADLKAVERLPDQDGHQVWREIDKHGQAMPLETVESLPPRRLVRRIADPKLPFGGTWTYEISPSEAGSALTITEDGEVYNPIFRFVSRFVFGHTATIDGYLKALGKKFNQEVVISSN